MTGRPLRILQAEDDPSDAKLIELSLRGQGVDATWIRVESMALFAEALDRETFDLIISDFTMPAFDGMRALLIAREKAPETPFIYVSGTIGEERAVEALRNGALDYVLKDKLYKLGPAVEHALRETALRKERQLAEEQMHKAHAQLQRILGASPAVIYTRTLSPEGALRTTFMSENAAAVLGFLPESFVDQPAFWAGRIHPGDAPDLPSDLRLPAPGGVRTLSYRFRHSDGRHRWISDKARVDRIDEAGCQHIVGSLTDVTEQLEGEQKFMTLAERSPSLILITRGSKVLFANNDCEKFLGVARAAIGNAPFDWMEKVLPESRELMGAFLENVEAGRDFETPEVVLPRPEGSPIWCILSGARVPFEGELATLVIATDVTQLHHLEEQKSKLNAQFQQSQKMEAVGRLAGGIAHDFNNMLMVIQGFTDFLVKKVSPDDPSARYFSEIRKATDRAASLTKQLLAFSRKQVLQLEALSLGGVVEDAAKMIRRVIGEDLLLSLELEDGTASVMADRGQVTQILLNLAVNARDAMPNGGSLRIATGLENVSVKESTNDAGVKTGRYVVLEVSDTGAGMDAETQSHLFEPFFTTKDPGKGTGLGLATVYGIVQQCGGYIACSTLAGKGTTFRIHMPCLEGPQKSEAGVPGTPPVTVGGTERILLVEDDEMVRSVTRMTLEAEGYSVVEAQDGADGLSRCAERGGDFSLLITDVVMPVMGGVAMAARVRELYPAMKILIMSGYIDQEKNGALPLGSRVTFLQKPIGSKALLSSVRAFLDGG